MMNFIPIIINYSRASDNGLSGFKIFHLPIKLCDTITEKFRNAQKHDAYSALHYQNYCYTCHGPIIEWTAA